MPTGNILVADDDAAIRTVLNQALARAGYEVRTTGQAATLWTWAAQGLGDLIITDVVMPDGNAFDLLPRIKRVRPELPIIVMSAQNTFMTAIKASERGAYEYLPKPFDVNKAVELVRRAVQESQREEVAESGQAQVDLFAAPPAAPAAEPSALERTLAGGGVLYSQAGDALRAFAELHGVPVAETQAGKSVLAWDHALNTGTIGVCGVPSANALAREADVHLDASVAEEACPLNLAPTASTTAAPARCRATSCHAAPATSAAATSRRARPVHAAASLPARHACSSACAASLKACAPTVVAAPLMLCARRPSASRSAPACKACSRCREVSISARKSPSTRR